MHQSFHQNKKQDKKRYLGTVILALIMLTFFIKGVFMASLFPVFQGPDEQTHYGTTQYFAEPKEKSWPITTTDKVNDKDDISTFNFSEEIINTAKIVKFDEIKWKRHNTQIFSDDYIGIEENEISNNSWKRYIDIYPPSINNGTPLYSYSTSLIEKIFSSQNILFRFYSVRIFSVLIGTIIILLAYLISRKIGFSEKNSLLLSAIVSFQPMFSFSSSIVNPDILLILAFTLFTFGSSWLLKDGLNWKNAAIILFSILVGVSTKGPGLILAVIAYPIFAYGIYKKLEIRKFYFFSGFIILSLILLLVSFSLIPKNYVGIGIYSPDSKFSSFSESTSKYYEKTLRGDKFKDTMLSYWGNFGWLDTKLPSNIIGAIWIVNIIAAIGIILFLVLRREKERFFPEKRFIIFFIFLIISLQLAIRLYDWIIFDFLGKISIGTPGRYFLPNVTIHFIILFTGLAAFFRKKIIFEIILKLALISMMGLYFYSVLNVIIPRYYL